MHGFKLNQWRESKDAEPNIHGFALWKSAHGFESMNSLIKYESSTQLTSPKRMSPVLYTTDVDNIAPSIIEI